MSRFERERALEWINRISSGKFFKKYNFGMLEKNGIMIGECKLWVYVNYKTGHVTIT